MPRLEGNYLLAGVLATSCSGFLLYGYDQGVLSGIITEENFLDAFPAMRKPLTQSFVVAIYEVGALFGAGFAALRGDVLGRRRAIILAAILILIGASIQTGAHAVWHLIVGRIIAGLGIGVLTSTVPTWQSEMAKPHLRGTLVMTEGACIVMGVALSYWTNLLAWHHFPGDRQWRLPIGLQLVPATTLLIGATLMPESPRWLMSKKRKEEAQEIVARIWAADEKDKHVKSQVKGMSKALEKLDDFRWGMLFEQGPDCNRYRTSISLGCQALQQLAGTNLLTYYQAILYTQGLGFDVPKTLLITACSGTEYFAAALLATQLIERVGRRPLFLWSSAAMALILATLGILVIEGSKPALYGAVVCVFLFNTAFALGWQASVWLYNAEVPNTQTRTQVSALGACCNWALNSVIVLVADPLINKIGGWTYLLFAGFNAVTVPIVYKYFIETKGLPLEQVDLIFAKSFVEEKSPVAIANDMEEMTESDAEDELQDTLAEAEDGQDDNSQNDTQASSQGEREPLLRNRRK